jgi:chitinase
MGGCASANDDGNGHATTGGVSAQGGASVLGTAGGPAAGGSLGGNGGQAGKPSMAGAAGVSGVSGSANGGNPSGGAGSAGDTATAGSSNAGTSGTGTMGGGSVGDLPNKIVAGYYPNWTPSPIRIKDVPAGYNVIYLFAAKPEGGSPGTTGAVTFADPQDGRGARTNFKADIQLARTTQQRKIVLSVGGQGGGMSFPSRSKSETFVASIEEIYDRLGGFDGLDWNTFEADQAPDTEEMIWISLELKRRHPGFLISAPPAPWNELDQEFCKTMVDAGAMDYAAPQYYDGPNLATQGYITQNVDTWVKLVGASHLVVGFGIWNEDNYMAIDDAVATWKQVEQKHPTLLGAFDWQIHIDEANGWSFVDQIGPLVAE